MKIKHLIIVSLLLAILTFGAVSASDDADAIAAEEDAGDQIVEAPANDEEVISESYGNGVYIYAYSEINTNPEDNDYYGYVRDTHKIDGTISLSIDNAQYYSKALNNYGYNYYYVYTSDFNVPDSLKTGTHNIVLTYLKNGVSDPYTLSKTSNFTYAPDVFSEHVSVGETAYVTIEHLPGSYGSATLYNYNGGDIGSAVASATIVNGHARIPVSGLAKGEHDLYLNMTINGKTYTDSGEITVKENTPGFTSSISSTQIVSGNSVTVTVNGPKTKGMVYIYVDGKPHKAVSLINGIVSESISGLTVGQHAIKVLFDSGNRFHSHAFNVNVKAKTTISLTLKKVTVKKSAKKLILQATLKINKKVAKSKTVKFKFNGKTYKAKTNKKGVAKVTIKKSVLKKLKVGKKVKYQASYGKKTVTKTAKVKK